MDIDILMILGLYPKENEKEIIYKSKKGRQDAANRFQWNLVKGFDCICENISILNAPYIDSFPAGYTDLFYRGGGFSHNNISADFSVSYINLPFISSFSKYRSSKKIIKRWLGQNNESRKIVVLYAMNSYMGLCAKYIKKISPETKICMVVPDLPEYAYNFNNRSFLYRYLISSEIKRSYFLLQYVDCIVGLTEKMHARLDSSKPFCVVDSIIDNNSPSLSYEAYCQNGKNITYTGTLSPKYGIKELVDSFMKTQSQELRLVICGAGDQGMESYIKKCSNIDSRIVFMGLLPHDKVVDIQKKSLLLVNPRKNDSEYTSYSFPSKVAEYMTTGVPVLMYKLDGMDDKYYDISFQFDNFNNACEAIEAICSLDRRTLWDKARAAQLFIREHNAPKQQCEKVINLILSLY